MSARERTVKLSWRELWPVWLAFGLLFGLGAFGLWVYMPESDKPVPVSSQDLTLSLAALESNKPSLFAYSLNPPTQVEFFTQKGNGNQVTVAFASCRKCYRSGHYRQANQILCGYCNQPMERTPPGESPGSERDCKLIQIPFEASGDHIIVRGQAVRDSFARWFSLLLSESAESHEQHGHSK